MCFSYFFLAGIKDITVIGPEEELKYARQELQGALPDTVNISFQPEAAAFPEERLLIEYRPAVIYGKDLTRIIERAMASETPIRLVNKYMKKPEVSLAIFPDGVSRPLTISTNSRSPGELISSAAQVEIERGVISIPIESSRDLETADNFMRSLTDVLIDRPDDIAAILKVR